MLIEDPVVSAVREARKRIEKKCNFDPHKMGQRARRLEKKYKNRLIYPDNLSHRQTA